MAWDLCWPMCRVKEWPRLCSWQIYRRASVANRKSRFRNWPCDERTVDLHSGDTLVLFSDGVTEAGVETDQEFGEDGLLSLIQSLGASTAEALVAAVIEAVAGEKQDDVTVVAVRVM